MNLLTVARRARLGERIRENQSSATDRLACAKKYLSTIAGSVRLPAREQEFHFATFLVGVVSIVEAYIHDSTREFIVCYPGRIGNKQISLGQLATQGSILYAVSEAAESTVRDLTYRSFPEMVEGCIKVFDSRVTLPTDLLEEVNEVKCTRDLVVHNNGHVNGTYLRKTGVRARAKGGERAPLSDAYVKKAVEALELLLAEFFRVGPGKFGDRGKVHAFREMWDATQLAKHVPFERAWSVESAEMVRPEHVEWPWSSSEKALYDFFLAIYGPHNPGRTTDAMEALYRWPPPYQESRVIVSWLESPFSF